MDLGRHIRATALAGTAPVEEALTAARVGARSGSGDLEAAVNAGSVLSFVGGLEGRDKDDVLFSIQFAQRAASAAADRFLEVGQWYRDYTEWLETLGWVVPQIGFDHYELGEADLEMDAAVLEIIAAIATGPQIAALTRTLDALRGLAEDDGAIKLFDLHTSVQFGGNFQMGAVQRADNGSLSVALGAFHFRSADRRQKFLFARWGSRSVNFWVSSQTITLNQTLYAGLRDDVAEALGDSARSLIAAVDLT